MTIGLKDLKVPEGLTGPARQQGLDEERLEAELIRRQIQEDEEAALDAKKEKERKSRLKRKNKKEID